MCSLCTQSVDFVSVVLHLWFKLTCIDTFGVMWGQWGGKTPLVGTLVLPHKQCISRRLRGASGFCSLVLTVMSGLFINYDLFNIMVYTWDPFMTEMLVINYTKIKQHTKFYITVMDNFVLLIDLTCMLLDCGSNLVSLTHAGMGKTSIRKIKPSFPHWGLNPNESVT